MGEYHLHYPLCPKRVLQNEYNEAHTLILLNPCKFAFGAQLIQIGPHSNDGSHWVSLPVCEDHVKEAEGFPSNRLNGLATQSKE